VAVIILGIFSFQFIKIPEVSDTEVKSGDYFPIPSVTANEGYWKEFKTYNTDFGFSFEYPSYLEAVSFQESTNYVVVSSPNKEDDDTSAIIISIADNDENLTAEEWLLGPTSGLQKGDEYFRSEIDGQPAVYTDGGMWTVVNTPDNKYRLSIADIKDKQILFTEMGIVIESLTFK